MRVVFQGRRLRSRGGLRSWAAELASAHGPVLAQYSARQLVDDVFVDIAFAWTASDTTSTRCFVNLAEAKGGTHVDGIAQGLAVAAEAMNESPALRPLGASLQHGLVAIVHVSLRSPRFRNPSKDHLASPSAGLAVARLLARDLPIAAERDRTLRTFIDERFHGGTRHVARP